MTGASRFLTDDPDPDPAPRTVWLGGAFAISLGAAVGHHISIDSSGGLTSLDYPGGSDAWWGGVQAVFFPAVGVCWLAWLAGQVLSFRRSSGELDDRRRDDSGVQRLVEHGPSGPLTRHVTAWAFQRCPCSSRFVVSNRVSKIDARPGGPAGGPPRPSPPLTPANRAARRGSQLVTAGGAGTVSPRLTLSGATLVVMNDIAQRPDANPGNGFDAGDPGGRLAAYQARTQTVLDLLALITLWFVVVPPWYYGQDVRGIWWALRIALSVVYGIDLAIRGVLAGRPVRYARANPLALAAVLFPPVRAIFSLRLVRAMFRRGHLARFLLTAAVLVLDGAIIVYLYERHAPHSSIHTLGESLWFSVVTVTTVGYGDYTPVTVYGRITAVLIMLVGLLTLAVVTAQAASSFVTQGPGRTQRRPQPEAASPEVTLTELDRRLARIEELLTASAPSQRTANAPGAQGEGTQPSDP